MGKGGVATGEIKGGVEVGLVAYAGALEGAGPLPEVPGFIESVAGDSGRPTVSTGNRGNKGSKGDRTHGAIYDKLKNS